MGKMTMIQRIKENLGEKPFIFVQLLLMITAYFGQGDRTLLLG